VGLNVLLLGPQGAGKGTQAKRIASAYGIPHVATGDMLRASIAERSDVGMRVKSVVESGRLVPDELMIDLIRARIAAEDTDAGFILDGFPRTTAQAEALDTMFGDIGRNFSVVFALQLGDQVAVERLLLRGKLEGRVDDNPDAIAKRLAAYHRETEPLVEYYRTRGNLVTINADRTEGEVFDELQGVLEQAAVA
jgi:adenylate kinase